MRRVVVYAGTRNVYHNMAVAAKSLLRCTRVDRVWFLIEDEAFPEPLPDVIRCKDMSGQKWFDPNGPNYNSRWSYMSMLRLALHEILPEEDRILWMDVDTIVRKGIGELLEEDLRGNYVGMAEEPIRSKDPFRYYNAGVMLMDLKKLRDGMARDMIWLINTQKLTFPDQDAVNILCQGRIHEISPYYNSNRWIVEVADPAVFHFAADRAYTTRDAWKEYDRMEWRVINAD